jgi:ribosome-associated protein
MDQGATIELCAHVRVLRAAVEIETCRSGGPGGQHVNTTDSAVQLRCPLWALIGCSPQALERLRQLAGSRLCSDDSLLLRCEQDRSQQRNRELVWERLRQLVGQALRVPRPRKATRPSRGSVERRLAGKRLRSDKKRQRRGDPEE